MRRRDLLAGCTAVFVPKCASRISSRITTKNNLRYRQNIMEMAEYQLSAVDWLPETDSLNRGFEELGMKPGFGNDCLKVLLLTDMVGTYCAKPQYRRECTELANENITLVDNTVMSMTDFLFSVESDFDKAGYEVSRNRDTMISFLEQVNRSAKKYDIDSSAISKMQHICDRINISVSENRFGALLRQSLAKAQRAMSYFEPVNYSSVGSADDFISNAAFCQTGGSRLMKRRQLVRETRLISAGWTVMGIGATVAGVCGLGIAFGAEAMVFGITAGALIVLVGMTMVIVNAIKANRK